MKLQDWKDVLLITLPALASFITWILTRRQRELESISIFIAQVENLTNEVVKLTTENKQLKIRIKELDYTIQELERKYLKNDPTRYNGGRKR